MESKLAFFTQKDITKPDGLKVRYISDPRIEINEMIEPTRHPMVRAPIHANVIRTILYWETLYPTTPELLRKRDSEGSLKLLPVSVVCLAHMSLQFPNYVILYLSLFIGWEPSHASWGAIPSLLLQPISPFTPRRPRIMWPERFAEYEYFDDGAFVGHWLNLRPWASVQIWEFGLQTALGIAALHFEKRIDG